MVKSVKSLKEISSLVPAGKVKSTEVYGSIDSTFAKIEGSVVTYKGECYTILNVAPGILVLDTEALTQFSKFGDELPLELCK